jgi:hypothetical protein
VLRYTRKGREIRAPAHPGAPAPPTRTVDAAPRPP